MSHAEKPSFSKSGPPAQGCRAGCDHPGHQQAVELLRLQRDLGIALGSARDLVEALELVLRSAVEIDGIDCGGMYIVDPATGEIALTAHTGLSQRFVEAVSHYPPDSHEARLLAAGKPVYWHDQENPRARLEPRRSERLRATAVIPVRHEERVVGSMNLASHTRDELPLGSRHALETIAARLGGVIARIRTEQSLDESGRNLQALFDTLDDLLFVLDQRGCILAANPAAERLLGYTRAELAGMHVSELHPADRRGEAAAVFSAILAGTASECLLPVVARDGRVIPVETKVTRGSWNGRPALFGVCRDVSQRVAAEQALRDSEVRFQAIFEAAAPGIAVSDLGGRLLDCNQAMATMLGYSVEELIGKLYSDITHPDDLENEVRDFTGLKEGLKDTAQIEKRYLHRSGEVLWARLHASLIRDAEGRPSLALGVIENVTESKRTQEALRRSESQLRSLFENIPDYVGILDRRGAVVLTNKSPAEIPAESLPGMVIFDEVAPANVEAVREAFQGALEGEGVRSVLAQAKHGRWYDSRFVPLDTPESGRHVMLIGSDVTEQKAAADRLAESEHRYRLIAENVGDVIWTLRLNPEAAVGRQERFPSVSPEDFVRSWQFEYFSPSVERVLGYRPEDAVELSLADILAPASYRQIVELAGEDFALLRRQPDQAYARRTVEVEFVRSSGARGWGEVTVSFLRDAEGRPLRAVGIVRDVTARREAAEAVRKEQQLLRRLLELHERDRQVIAYDIHDGLAQQLTAAMFQFEGAARLQGEAPQRAGEALEQGLKSLAHSLSETRRLISGLRPPILDEAGIVAALDYVVCEHRQRGGPDIELRADVAFDRLAPPLETAIFRIVQESLSNACRHSRSDRVAVELSQHKDRVHLSVRDWGVGFDPQKIDEQRFGLRGIRERVRLLGGHVKLLTAAGKGTQIDVELPLIDAAVAGE